MDDMQTLLADTASRLFSDNSHLAPQASTTLNNELWGTVRELGLVELMISEERGGSGCPWSTTQSILRPSGYHNIPLPLAEAILAAKLLDTAGLSLDGNLTVAAPSTDSLIVDNRVSCTLYGVPWGREAQRVVTTMSIEGKPHIVVLPVNMAQIVEGLNLAEEPRDTLRFIQSEPIGCVRIDEDFDLNSYLSLLRLPQIQGALEYALKLSVDYANERKQFGRAIGKFQAVQQQLATFSSEVAAVSCAVQSAFNAADHGTADFQISAAKLRANMAIGVATATAHQVHAAIGFTREYPLRLATQRLLSWRNEYGNDAYWAQNLGKLVSSRGADNFWNDLTMRDDKVSCR